MKRLLLLCLLITALKRERLPPRRVMKRLLLLCLLTTSSAHAQRALQKNPNTGALIEGFASGANTIKISATGTLEFVSGFTLTGGSYLKTALSLNNVENTALSTWAGTSNITTIGTITTGTWNGTAIAIANGGTGSTTAANARAALGLAIGADVMAYTATSTGGNAAADSAKLALYSASGQLTGTGVRSNASGGTSQYGLLGERGVDFTNVLGSGFSQGIIAASPTTHRSHTLPDRSGTLLHADGDGSALTGLSPYQLAQVSATDGQALAWNTANSRWQPLTISSGLTIGSTTTSGASAGDILTSDGTNLQKLTPGTGVSTWLATPTLANLNSAVSDADLATLAANTFTAAQVVNMGDGDPFKVQRSSAERFKITTTATAGNIWFGDASYFTHETSNGSWIMKYGGSERGRIIFAENAYNIELKTATTGDNGVLIANNSYNGAYLASDMRLNTTVGVFKIEANPRQAIGAYTGPGHTLALIGGQAQTTSTGGAGGLVSINGGAAGGSGNNNGGNVTIQGGAPTGSGTKGTVTIGSRGSGISDIATVVKAAYDPASIAAGATETTTATITGCAAGSTYIPTPIYHAGLIISANRTGTDTVTITIYNPTAASIDAGAVDIRVTEIAF
jgi:hypothetical protein